MKMKFFAFTFIFFAFTFILPLPVLASTLSLSPSKASFNKGCNFNLEVNLDTQGVETDGSDVILTFDPQKYSATSITNGSIYSDFPGNNIDNQAGKVSIFALAPTDKSFSGKGVVATISFTTLSTAASGVGTINFDFDPSDPLKTTDSNVIQKSGLKDTLNEVVNGSYTIGSGICGASTEASSSASEQGGLGGNLPESGFIEETWVVGSLGGLLVLIGFFGLRKYGLSERC